MTLGHSRVKMSKEDDGHLEFKLLHQLFDGCVFYVEKYILFVLSYEEQEVGLAASFHASYIKP